MRNRANFSFTAFAFLLSLLTLAGFSPQAARAQQVPSNLVLDTNSPAVFATTHAASTPGTLSAPAPATVFTIPSGNVTDIQGGVYSPGAGLLTATPDTLGTSPSYDFARDFLTFPASLTPGTTSVRLVVDFVLGSGGSFSVCPRFAAATKHAEAATLASDGTLALYNFAGGTAFNTVASGSYSGASAGDTLETDVTISGASPCTLTATFRDLTKGTTFSTLTGTDTDSSLQAAGQVALTLHGAASTVSRIRVYTLPVVTLSLTAPASGQVVQRTGASPGVAGIGSIPVAGTNADSVAHTVQASFNGGPYQVIASNVAAGATFSGTLTGQVPGQGTLTVQFADQTGTTATVMNVGVGDVYLIAGQSNGVGQGSTLYSPVSGTGLAAEMFGYDYLWHALADPVGGTSAAVDSVSTNATAGGSVWPLVATRLMASQRIPIAFIPAAHDGSGLLSNNGNNQWTPLPSNHQDRTTLYGASVYRAIKAGGVRGVLYWGGETDGMNGIAASAWTSAAQTLTTAFKADLGVKTMFCQIDQCSAFSLTNQQAINAGIAAEWATDANALAGPSVADMTSDDAYHLITDAKVQTAAARWSDALTAAFYVVPPSAAPVAPTGVSQTLPGGAGQVGLPVTILYSLVPAGATSTGTVVTPSETGAAGTFSPATVTLTTAQPVQAVIWTPTGPGVASFSAAAPTGLTQPPSASLAVSAPASGTAALVLTTVLSTQGQPVLTWTADPLATGYRVLRSPDGVTYTVVATVGAVTTYTDTTAPAGNLHYHIVPIH